MDPVLILISNTQQLLQNKVLQQEDFFSAFWQFYRRNTYELQQWTEKKTLEIYTSC